MNPIPHEKRSTGERVTRAVFWALALLTVALASYGLAVESFGVGLLDPHQHVPKLHMTVEAKIAGSSCGITGISLSLLCLFSRQLTFRQRLTGYAIVAFWLFYFAIPRV